MNGSLNGFLTILSVKHSLHYGKRFLTLYIEATYYLAIVA